MPHVVFAIDESGSTAWFHAYHDRVYDIARRLSNRSQSDEKLEITVLNWSDRCYKGRLDETLANSAPGGPRRGGGGTYVTPLYDKLEVLETIDELILITDGEIDRGSVEKVFANVLGHGIKWKFTEAHIVSNGVPSVSVIAPFIYKTKYAIYDNTSYETPKAACAHVDVIEFIDGIRTEEQFRAEYDRLYDRISADTLVRADPSIRQSLLVMQKRIIANSASAAKDDELTLDAAAIEKCAVDWYNNATGLDISGMISRLVNMCSTTSHDLRLARFERSYKAIESVQVGDSDDTTIAVVEEICADYEDPVLMDKDMPVVLFMQGPGVLTGLDNDEIRREIERCPLNLLKYDFLVDAISKRINPVHGLRFCREYLASTKGQTTYYDDYYSDEDGPDFGNGGGEFVSPETRKPLMKEIMCLSVHESHTRANKACIAKLLSGTNRLCGQYGLWMVVFYSILKRRSFVNSEIGGVLDTFMKELAMNTPPDLWVFMGLDGSGRRPTIKVPIAHALLYAIVSTRLWAEQELARDVMRDLYRVYRPIKAVLQLALPSFDFTPFDRRMNVFEVASKLLWTIKQPASSAKVVMKGLRESFMKRVVVGGKSYVLDDVEQVPGDDVVTQLYLLENKLVHQNFKFTDVRIPFDYVPKFKMYETVYNEAENTAHMRPNVEVYIHPRTLRPLADTWKYKSEQIYGDIRGQVSIHYQLLKYYLKHSKFPMRDSETDLKEFLDQLERVYSGRGCLPVSIVFLINNCIDEIMTAFEKRTGPYRDVEQVKRDIIAGDSYEGRVKLESEDY